MVTEIPKINPSNGFEDHILRALKSHGVVIVPSYINNAALNTLNTEFDTIHKGIHGVRPLEVDGGQGADVLRLKINRNELPSTFETFNAKWMQTLSDQFWKTKALLNDHVYVMQEWPQTEHVAQDLHFDVVKTLKFFIYLNDINKDNGAFECVPGSMHHSEKTRLKTNETITYTNREMTREHPFSNSEIIPIEAPAGTLIVFSTETWHRAGKVKKGKRRIMRGHTRPKPSLFSNIKKILPDLTRT